MYMYNAHVHVHVHLIYTSVPKYMQYIALVLDSMHYNSMHVMCMCLTCTCTHYAHVPIMYMYMYYIMVMVISCELHVLSIRKVHVHV